MPIGSNAKKCAGKKVLETTSQPSESSEAIIELTKADYNAFIEKYGEIKKGAYENEKENQALKRLRGDLENDAVSMIQERDAEIALLKAEINGLRSKRAVSASSLHQTLADMSSTSHRKDMDAEVEQLYQEMKKTHNLQSKLRKK